MLARLPWPDSLSSLARAQQGSKTARQSRAHSLPRLTVSWAACSRTLAAHTQQMAASKRAPAAHCSISDRPASPVSTPKPPELATGASLPAFLAGQFPASCLPAGRRKERFLAGFLGRPSGNVSAHTAFVGGNRRTIISAGRASCPACVVGGELRGLGAGPKRWTVCTVRALAHHVPKIKR